MDETLPPQKTPDGRSPPARTDGERTREIGAPRTRIGPYEVETLLGEGGMGKVYRCRDPLLRRAVAVKVLREKFAADERYRARFLREARTIASLSHPAIAQVHAVETTSENSCYIVMEYVDGRSLEDLLEADGPPPPPDALGWVLELARGLEAAREREIVHRDVKPSNVLIARGGAVKLVDFGLAKELTSASTLTDDGIVLGTPQYISPEQGRGEPVDHRSDIYSLGATFYHAVVGTPLFEGKSQIATIVAHVQETPDPPHAVRPEVDPAYSLVIGRMLAIDPDDRYSEYSELICDLEALGEDRPPPHATASRSGNRFPPRRTRRARRFRIALVAAFLLCAVAALCLALPIVRRGTPAQAVSTLSSWYVAGAGGEDVLDLDFAHPPPGGVRLADVFTLGTGPGDAGPGTEPHIERGTLAWKDWSGPIGLRHHFDRIDEIALHVASHKGLLDLGLYVIHLDGNARRSLCLRLRPSEEGTSPVMALRNNEPIAAVPPPRPLPRLVPPYEIVLGLQPRGDGVHLSVRATRRSPARRTESRILYEESCRLPGDDWNRGVVVLRTQSAGRPFSVGLERLVVSGRLSGKVLESTPWHDSP